MNFKFFRNKINSRNVSVKELINDIFLKIDSKDPQINYLYDFILRVYSSLPEHQVQKYLQHLIFYFPLGHYQLVEVL